MESRPRRWPMLSAVERRGGQADGAGGAGGLPLRHDQRAGGRGQRGAFGDAVAADLVEHHVGRVGEAGGFLLQPGGVEEADGHAQRRRCGVDGRFVHLDVDRAERRDGLLGQPGGGQRFADQGRHFLRRRAALAADADRQDGRVVDELRLRNRLRPVR